MWMWITQPTSSVERGPSDRPVMRRHSKLTGDCAIRGARTPTDGSGVSSVPPVVVLGISPGDASGDGYKDTERNIRDSGEFVWRSG